MNKIGYLAGCLLLLTGCESRHTEPLSPATPFPAEDFRVFSTLVIGDAPNDYGIKIQVPDLPRGYRCSVERVLSDASSQKFVFEAESREYVDRTLAARSFATYGVTCIHQKHSQPLQAWTTASRPADLVIPEGATYTVENQVQTKEYSFGRIFMRPHSKLQFDLHRNPRLLTAWELLAESGATLDLRKSNVDLTRYEESEQVAGSDLAVKPIPPEAPQYAEDAFLADYVTIRPNPIVWDQTFFNQYNKDQIGIPYGLDTLNQRVGWKFGDQIATFLRSTLHLKRLRGPLKILNRRLFFPNDKKPEATKDAIAGFLLQVDESSDWPGMEEKADAVGTSPLPLCVRVGAATNAGWTNGCDFHRQVEQNDPLSIHRQKTAEEIWKENL